MSIDYTFTQHGTIQIQCGEEWIEVRLPGAGGGVVRRHPPPDPLPRTRPAGLPGERKTAPEPPVGPGVMSIIGSIQKPRNTKNLFVFDASDMAVRHMDLSQFEHFDIADPKEAIRRQTSRLARSMGKMKVLEVDVSPRSKNSTTALTNLQKLLNEPDSGIDALRLWHKDDIG